MSKILILIIFLMFLSGCGEKSNKDQINERWFTQAQVEQGRIIYNTNCSGCHNDDAKGTPDWKKTLPDGSYPPPPLDGTAHAWHHSISVLKRTIIDGGVPFGGKMPAFKGKLDDREILSVIAYFQSKWSKEIYSGWIERGGLEDQ